MHHMLIKPRAIFPGLPQYCVLILFWVTLLSGRLWAQSPLRPGDLLANPGAFLGRSVEVQIVEPLQGPRSAAALASAEYGQIRVWIPDGMGVDFSLVPASFRMEDPQRYRRKFDRVIAGPVRVRGELLSDAELAKGLGRPAYVLRVASVESLPPGPAVTVSSLAELQARAAALDRQSIVYEGIYRSGFEVSALDGVLWLAMASDTEILGTPPARDEGRKPHRIRVTGILFSKPGARYGHLGGYSMQIQASKVEYLGEAGVPR